MLKGETTMLRKKIKYTDYDGVEREEEFLFNLNKAEIIEMQLDTYGGMDNFIQKLIDTKDVPKLAALWKKIILKAYGEKSDDGKRFIKSEEISTAFSQTEAYSELYTELCTDSKAASDFMNGIIPALKDQNGNKPVNIPVNK